MPANRLVRLASVVLMTLSADWAYGRDLIVLSSGRGSCSLLGNPSEVPMWAPLENVIPAESDVQVIRTCFALDRHEAFYDVLTRDDGRHWRQTVSRQRGSRDGVLNSVIQRVRAFEGDRVTLVGQSYGAWMAARIATAQRRPRLALVTIDVVSPLTCGTMGFLFGSNGCRGFPNDLAEIFSARPWAGSWINYYQTQYAQLRGGPSPMAGENVHLRYETYGNLIFGAHAATETDPRIWGRVRSLLTR